MDSLNSISSASSFSEIQEKQQTLSHQKQIAYMDNNILKDFLKRLCPLVNNIQEGNQERDQKKSNRRFKDFKPLMTASSVLAQALGKIGEEIQAKLKKQIERQAVGMDKKVIYLPDQQILRYITVDEEYIKDKLRKYIRMKRPKSSMAKLTYTDKNTIKRNIDKSNEVDYSQFINVQKFQINKSLRRKSCTAKCCTGDNIQN